MNTTRFLLRALLMTTMLFAVSAVAQDMHNTGQFQGPKANKGHVTHSTRDGKSVLTLSDDFVVPDTPDPHWQLVDSDGNVYLVDKLKKKALIGDKYQKTPRRGIVNGCEHVIVSQPFTKPPRRFIRSRYILRRKPLE